MAGTTDRAARGSAPGIWGKSSASTPRPGGSRRACRSASRPRSQP